MAVDFQAAPVRGERKFRLWNIYINVLAGEKRGKKSYFHNMEEKGILGNTSRGSVLALPPSRALGKQDLTEGNVIFGGS